MSPRTGNKSETVSRNRNGHETIRTGLSADAIAEALIDNLHYLQAKLPLLKVVFMPDFNVKNGQRVYPCRRSFRTDLDGRQRGLGHGQYEIRHERGVDYRHVGRSQH